MVDKNSKIELACTLVTIACFSVVVFLCGLYITMMEMYIVKLRTGIQISGTNLYFPRLVVYVLIASLLLVSLVSRFFNRRYSGLIHAVSVFIAAPFVAYLFFWLPSSLKLYPRANDWLFLLIMGLEILALPAILALLVLSFVCAKRGWANDTNFR